MKLFSTFSILLIKNYWNCLLFQLLNVCILEFFKIILDNRDNVWKWLSMKSIYVDFWVYIRKKVFWRLPKINKYQSHEGGETTIIYWLINQLIKLIKWSSIDKSSFSVKRPELFSTSLSFLRKQLKNI